MRILYLGYTKGVYADRIRAMRRLGHTVEVLGEASWQLPGIARYQEWWTWHRGSWGLQPLISRYLIAHLPGERFDVAWVDSSPVVDGPVIEALRRRCGTVLHYNQDDPFGTRDLRKWTVFQSSVSQYDLLVVLRAPNVEEGRRLGARRILRVFFCADEVSHAPRVITPAIQKQWHSEVLFIGTWFPERGPLCLELVRRGVPLTIIGSRWDKDPHWDELKPFWRRSAATGDDYAYAIQTARLCLGLVSKGNRDQHTTRSLEVPSLGGLLCAERTPEHLSMYRDGEEAVFWSDPAECAARCHELLADEPRRAAIAQRGHERFLRDSHHNEVMCRQVLEAAQA